MGYDEAMKDGRNAKQQKVKVAKEAKEENKNKDSINGS